MFADLVFLQRRQNGLHCPFAGRLLLGSLRRFVRCRLTCACVNKLIGKQRIILIIKACFHFNRTGLMASIWLSGLTAMPSRIFFNWCDPRLHHRSGFRLCLHYSSDIAFRQGKGAKSIGCVTVTTIPVVSPEFGYQHQPALRPTRPSRLRDCGDAAPVELQLPRWRRNTTLMGAFGFTDQRLLGIET